jgi:rRNA-processing protein FCF1
MGREEYVQKLLDAYRTTPGTTGSIRTSDRILATRLHQRGVPLLAVENALVLAVARRLQHSPEALPLGTIRSLA